MTTAHSVGVATKVLEQLIARGVSDVIGLRVETGDQETITGSVRDWLRTPGHQGAIAIDLRTPGEAVLAHSDVMCRMRYARDRVDFTVRDLVCDGPAMHQPALVAALESFVQEHRP
jgi:hypothetical protein